MATALKYGYNTISVIIPVYNVEAYLPQCLDSVLSQSYSDLQVILIDDGSKDKSGTICDEYAARDSRIMVIHQKNAGAAAAKNAGLRVATGKYLSFVDSDDYLEPEAYAHMILQLEASKADVIQCAFCDVYPDKAVPHITQGEQTEFTCVRYLEQFTKDWTCGLLWDKLYVRSIFDGIFFEEGHKIDDEYFTYRGIMNARKVVRDNVVIYNYRKRRSSVMYSPESGKQIVKDRIDYLSKRRVNVINRFPELRRSFDRHFAEMMVILSHDPLATKESNALIKQQLCAYFKEKNHTSVDVHLWPALLKLWCGLAGGNVPKEENASELQYFD
jgi:glycosyltransferase involved in cell wall biosynthesis